MPEVKNPASSGGICTQNAPKFDDASRAKAQEARAAKIAEGAKYRRDFMDADSWDQQAKSRGVRLPAWWVAPTPAALRKWSKRLVEAPFKDAFGGSMYLPKGGPRVTLFPAISALCRRGCTLPAERGRSWTWKRRLSGWLRGGT